MRLQLLARDLILAVSEPRGLSVRNQLRGAVRGITSSGGNDLVEVDCAGVTLLSRVTGAATRELALAVGMRGLGAGQGRVGQRPCSTGLVH